MSDDAKMLTIEACEEALAIPVAEWEGNCFAIAKGLVEAGLVRGRYAYGHYLGPVSPDGFWRQTAGLPFHPHGWVVLDDGNVFDPTRWSFEAVEPYLFVGSAEFYDWGGNSLRAERERPCPSFTGENARGKRVSPVDLRLTAEARAWLVAISEGEADPVALDDGQLFWVANLSVGRLSAHAREIYQALVDRQLGALIPIDNRSMILGDR